MKVLAGRSVPPFFVRLYDYAWFVGFAIAFAVYLVCVRQHLILSARRQTRTAALPIPMLTSELHENT